MKKFILAFVSCILKLQDEKHEKRKQEFLTSNERGVKTVLMSDAQLEIKNKVLDDMKRKVTEEIAPIIKENIKTPEKILDYIEKNGTKVYRLKNAKKILSAIGEQEGFITPIRGMKAVYLNFSLRGKFSTRTDEMFVLNNSEIDIYTMAHQFYKWCGWKAKMPGYDNQTQENFKKVWLFNKDVNIQNLTYKELANLKEAIHRDIEAIDFVIKLAQENEGIKKGFNNIQNGGADI